MLAFNNFLKWSLIVIFNFLLSYNAYSQTAVLKGKVSDANTNKPIPFATVIVYGTQIGTVTDVNGVFVLNSLKPGYVRVLVSFVGYKDVISNQIFVSNASIPFLEVTLEQSSIDIEAVVIKSDILRKSTESPVSMQRIGIKQIESNPGSNRDISRVIQSFPGVGSTPAYRNDVIIRGGGPSENRFFLDEVEIPVLNHFSTQGASGGPVGIINADFIKSVDFYSGAFPASKYNALSGVLSFTQKQGSRDKTNAQLAVGASETSFTVDGPLFKNSSYIFSVRRSYLQLLFSAIGLPFLPTFNDYQLKINTDIDEKNKLTIVSIGSLDNLKLNTSIDNPDESQEYILSQIPINNQWSYTVGVVYKHFSNYGYHTVVVSKNTLSNTFFKYPDNNESQEKVFDYYSTESENKFRYEFSSEVYNFRYKVGVSGEYAQYYNNTSRLIYENNASVKTQYSSSLDLFKYGMFAQLSRQIFSDKLLMSLGLRSDANNYNSNTKSIFNHLSPRLSLSYSLSNKFKINGSVGRYFQLPAYTTMGFRDNNNFLVNSQSLDYIGVNHYNLGVEQRLNQKVLLSGELFYKDYFNYPVDIFTGASIANQGAGYSSVVGASNVAFTGFGQAYGFELLSRVNADNFSFIGSYTFVRSLFSDINNVLIPSSWDSRHLITITGTKEFKRNWQLGFKWRFVGGLPYTPYDLQTSANVEAWKARGEPYLNYSQLNALRFNPFHQLDIRVDKNYYFKKWSLMIYLDIQNVYNFKNRGQDFVVREKDSNGNYIINNALEYNLKLIENQSGTVLPSVGIMIKI